jgi:hypothetical protein
MDGKPAVQKETKMRALFAFVFIAGVWAEAIGVGPAAAGQHCRMEKQCRWVNYKKICTYVRVCRDY